MKFECGDTRYENEPSKAGDQSLEDSEEVYAQYELVAKDLENGITNSGVWAKAFADSNGDELATKALYMKLMVERALQERARADTPKVREYADQKAAPQASVIDDQITSQPKSRSKLDWSSMPWLDRFALILSVGGVSAFIANAVTSIGLGLKFDLAQIVFNPILGPSYFGAVLGLLVLLTRGYFRRSSQSQAKTEESYTQLAEGAPLPKKEMSPAAATGLTPSSISKNNSVAPTPNEPKVGSQISAKNESRIDPGIFFVIGFILAMAGAAGFIISGTDESYKSGVATAEQQRDESAYMDALSEVEKASYLIGYRQVQDIRAQGSGIVDTKAYASGTSDAIAGTEPRISLEDEDRVIGVLANALKQQVASSNELSAQKIDASADISGASYLIGFRQAQNIRHQGGDAFSMRAYGEGVLDAVIGSESQVPLQSEERLMAVLSRAMMPSTSSDELFMANNGAKPGVFTTVTGLQYEILIEGTGPKPEATDTVVAHYHGTFTDGTVFDSSVERGSPASFPVNRVIPGWTEALQMMGVGSKWRLVVPPELAYGERGAGGVIPPNATLFFEVELMDIVKES